MYLVTQFILNAKLVQMSTPAAPVTLGTQLSSFPQPQHAFNARDKSQTAFNVQILQLVLNVQAVTTFWPVGNARLVQFHLLDAISARTFPPAQAVHQATP